MRNYVSKMLVGAGVANVDGTNGLNIHTGVADGAIAIFDWDQGNNEGDVPATTGNGSSVSASTKNIGVVKGGGSNGQIIAGPFPASSLKVYKRANSPAVQQQGTLQVTSIPGADAVGMAVVFKVVYHQNLSIVPNLIKNFAWSVPIDDSDTSGSVEDWRDKIFAALEKSMADDADANLPFTAAETSTDTITFTAKDMDSDTNYNEIDRPEQLFFELAVTAKVRVDTQAGLTPPLPVYEDSFTQGASYDKGEYTLIHKSNESTMASAIGTYSHVRWLEDQHMGRLGYSDRRLWFDTKKYVPQADSSASYDILIMSATMASEGDLQDTMVWPVGCVIASTTATTGVLVTDLETVLGTDAVIEE